MKSRPSPPAPHSTRGRTWLVCLSLAILTLLVFGRTIRHEFVNYDDDVYVYENALVSDGLTWQGIAAAFTGSHARNWHPLTTLSHMLDSQLFGLRPSGHHATSVLLHTAAVLLLFGVLRDMTGTFWRSAFVAALFAVHPLRAESVAWISERKDLLSGVFLMLAIAAYVRYARQPSIARYSLLLLTFACGLMSKAMLVTLPFVLLLLDAWPLGRFARQAPAMWRTQSARLALALEKLPLLALSIAASAITFLVQKRLGYLADDLPLLSRINNAAVAYVTYIWRMIVPADLAAFYPHPLDRLPVWQIAGAFALLVGLSALVVFWWRQRPYLATGWFWFVGMLVPVIGVVEVGSQASADRYTYLPHIGLYICVAWMASELFPRWALRRQFLGAAAAVVIATCSGIAWQQTAHWRNSETLWKRALAVTSDNDIAHLNLGDVVFKRGQVDEALARYETAIKIRSQRYRSGYDFPLAVMHSSLGSALHRKGRFEEALGHFRRAIRLQPDYGQAHVNLASTLGTQGRREEAMTALREAIAQQPENADAHITLGTLLLETGSDEQAVASYERALAIAPRATTALNNLAWLYATSSKPSLRNAPRAVILAERAVAASKEKDPFLLHKLGAAYAASGRFPQAVQTAEEALQLATAQRDAALAGELKRNLALYRSGSPIVAAPLR